MTSVAIAVLRSVHLLLLSVGMMSPIEPDLSSTSSMFGGGGAVSAKFCAPQLGLPPLPPVPPGVPAEPPEPPEPPEPVEPPAPPPGMITCGSQAPARITSVKHSCRSFMIGSQSKRNAAHKSSESRWAPPPNGVNRPGGDWLYSQ